MRVILIEEDRFVDFTNALRLVESDKRNDNTAERLKWDLNIWHAALDEARRTYHYEFVRWAQSHGASCISR